MDASRICVFLSHWGWVTHTGVSEKKHPCNWFKLWLAPGRRQSHRLIQCWSTVNWTPENKLKWNLNRNLYIFVQENTFENVACKWPPFCLGLNVLIVNWMPYCSRVYDMFPSLVISWWRHQMETFRRYWPFVRGIHGSPVNSPHKGQWRGALVFSLICAWINGWVNNHKAGDLRRHRAHYDVTVMSSLICSIMSSSID